MKKSIVIILLAPFSLIRAQHFVDYTQYMFNALLFNPAYAGSTEALNLTGLYRKQWSGIDGAPVTMSFGAHTELKNKWLNLGFISQNESIGIFNATRIAGIYTYRFRLGAGFLAFGLQGGANIYNNSWSRVKTTEENDPGFMMANERKVSPGAAFGAYYHSRKFYLGASLPELFDNNSMMRNAVNVHSGYVINAGESLHIKPAMIMRYISGSPLSVNGTVTFYWKDLIGLGAGYTLETAAIALADIKVNDQLRFGYGFSYPLNHLKLYTNGSHEAMLRYIFSFKSNSPSARYF